MSLSIVVARSFVEKGIAGLAKEAPFFFPFNSCTVRKEGNKKHVGEADLWRRLKDGGVVEESHNDMPKPKDTVEPDEPTQKYGTV